MLRLPADAVCHDRAEVLDTLRPTICTRACAESTRSSWSLDGQPFNVFTVREGRIASIQDYATRAEALRAAGGADPAWR